MNVEEFNQSPEEILRESDLLIQDDCIVYKGVLYERLGKGVFDDVLKFEHKYRFFFNSSDYDYLEDDVIEKKLDEMFMQVDAEVALYQQELKE